jgi:adenosylhomocysteine nucleosidase
MLLRSLVNQLLRDAAEGKVRAAIAGVKQQIDGEQQASGSENEAAPQSLPSRTVRAARSAAADPPPGAAGAAAEGGVEGADEFLPCEAVFLFALGIESGGLVDRLKGAENSRHAHGVEHAGRLEGREVAIVEGGVGGQAAARAAAEVIRFYQPRWVVSAGFAGGLNESLRRGHIVLADEVVNLRGERLAVGLKLDAASLAATKGLHVGRLLTVDSIVRRPDDRRRLAAEHQAIGCDMESYAIAEICRQQGVPFLAVRIISDAVDDVLPPEIEHLVAQKSLAGKLGAAAGAIYKRWGAAKDLWQLREDAIKASDRLAKFLASMLSQLPKSQ